MIKFLLVHGTVSRKLCVKNKCYIFWPVSIVLCVPVQAKLLLRMLAYLSESISNAFMVDELRARIAQMLGYFLDHLVGRKSKNLKVRVNTLELFS